MNKKFSIITITKDNLFELKRTFQSLQNQTLKDFEWIVIDGASSDGTSEWLSCLEMQTFEVKWKSEIDFGISDAWNKGIALSSGEQVLILNSGDTYDPNMIEVFSKKISSNSITCSNARLIDPVSLKQVGVFRAEPHKLWRGMHLPHNWCAVPRIYYEFYGDYPLIKYAMDFSWFHKFYKLNKLDSFHCINIELGNYHLGGVSDKNYIKSFTQNRNILIENGYSKFIAYALFCLYTIKHALNKIK